MPLPSDAIPSLAFSRASEAACLSAAARSAMPPVEGLFAMPPVAVGLDALVAASFVA